MQNITVHVVKYRDRKNLVMRYVCPLTGRQVQRTTGTNLRSKAEKAAAKWEAALQEGRYQRDSRIGWEEFRELHLDQHLSDLAPDTIDAYCTALNAYERVCRPKRLSDATTARVSHFKAHLRKNGRKPATVASYLRHISAAFRWAKRQGLMSSVPDCSPPKGAAAATRMKGRPITGEEFERMLAAVPKIAGKLRVADWEFYLQALWTSGLRLSESLTLSWEEQDEAISVDLRGRRPMLRIPAAVEKGKRNRVLPMTPDFAALLEAVPDHERRGRVFAIDLSPEKVSAAVTKIGKAAGVRVNTSKFASAHDLRRAFGTRWSKVLSPARLKAIMRHSDISTTMRYYVDEASEELADALFEAAGPNRVPTEVPSSTSLDRAK